MESAPNGNGVPGAHPEINPWIIAVAVMLGTFMEVLDTTVVNVALPHIAGNLSATVDETTWVLTSYLVSNAIILPIAGWLSNHFGRKRILMASVRVYGVFAGLRSGPQLANADHFRVIQGATGGGLQPLSQAIMLEAFPAAGSRQGHGILGIWYCGRRRCLGRCSADGLPTRIAGAGSSTSTYRSA